MKIILVDLRGALVAEWRNAMGDMEEVSVHQGSIFEVDCDALVSPANSFGFMDGGLDLRISEYFGWHVQERLQRLIRDRYYGELLVGTAEIVPTGHPAIPYMISAPTMRVPMVPGRETVNVYLATRAALLLIEHGRLEDGTPVRDQVHSVALPGMGTGVGKVPAAICARQMKQAIEDVRGAYQFPRTWSEAQRRHQLLYSDAYRDLQY